MARRFTTPYNPIRSNSPESAFISVRISSRTPPESRISLCPEIPKAFYVKTHSALARITHSEILTYLKDKGYVRVDQIADGLGIADSMLSDHLTITKPCDCSSRTNLATIKDLIVSL